MARMDDGHSTTIAFTDAYSTLTAELFEKQVQPPSVEGGGEIDTTTMQNSAYRTKLAKQLKTLGQCTLQIAYDPAIYDAMISMVNDNQLITITFPDTSTLAFWGWIDVFSPNPLVEGEQPVADITIICSNQNDSKVETAPVFTDA